MNPLISATRKYRLILLVLMIVCFGLILLVFGSKKTSSINALQSIELQVGESVSTVITNIESKIDTEKEFYIVVNSEVYPEKIAVRLLKHEAENLEKQLLQGSVEIYGIVKVHEDVTQVVQTGQLVYLDYFSLKSQKILRIVCFGLIFIILISAYQKFKILSKIRGKIKQYPQLLSVKEFDVLNDNVYLSEHYLINLYKNIDVIDLSEITQIKVILKKEFPEYMEIHLNDKFVKMACISNIGLEILINKKSKLN